jgi:hypothetical protein
MPFVAKRILHIAEHNLASWCGQPLAVALLKNPGHLMAVSDAPVV